MPIIAPDVATADRVMCTECGLVCDLGDCDFDVVGNPRCPECYAPMEDCR